ncbi:AMP-binding protein [Streptomyces sp. NPDC014889]|uniref:AMP-binding protein n=1 Tax=Streptomyces sp. NPDC014889 TaxID=3364928 RepID=UPI0036F7700B
MVFVPPEPGNGELEALIERADGKMLLFDPVFEERTQRIARRIGIPHVFSIGASSSAADFLAAASDTADCSLGDAADGRHIATLLYTGGTTGLPKLVVHRNGYYDLYAQASSAYAADPSADDALLICTLVTHTSGHGAFLVGVLSGHTIVLPRTFEAGAALSAMDSERVTRMMVVTPMLYELLDHPDCRTGRFPALSTLHYTGAAAGRRRRRRRQRLVPATRANRGVRRWPLRWVLSVSCAERTTTSPRLASSGRRTAQQFFQRLPHGEGLPRVSRTPSDLPFLVAVLG